MDVKLKLSAQPIQLAAQLIMHNVDQTLQWEAQSICLTANTLRDTSTIITSAEQLESFSDLMRSPLGDPYLNDLFTAGADDPDYQFVRIAMAKLKCACLITTHNLAIGADGGMRCTLYTYAVKVTWTGEGAFHDSYFIPAPVIYDGPTFTIAGNRWMEVRALWQVFEAGDAESLTVTDLSARAEEASAADFDLWNDQRMYLSDHVLSSDNEAVYEQVSLNANANPSEADLNASFSMPSNFELKLRTTYPLLIRPATTGENSPIQAAAFDALMTIQARQELELKYLTRLMVITLTTLTKNVAVSVEELDRLQQLGDEEFKNAITSGEISDLSNLATSNQMTSIQASLQLLLQNALLRNGDSNNAALEKINAKLNAQRREQPVATLASVISLLK